MGHTITDIVARNAFEYLVSSTSEHNCEELPGLNLVNLRTKEIRNLYD